MTNKEYYEKIRQAKKEMKDKLNGNKKIRKFDKSQWITFALMVFWTISSILGIFAFARSFNQRSDSVRVIGASAATSSDIVQEVPTVFTYRPQGLLGAQFIQTYTQSNGYSYGVLNYSLTALEFRIDTANKTFSVRYNDADTAPTSNGFAYDIQVDLTTTQQLEFFPAFVSPSAYSSTSFNSNTFSMYQPSFCYLNFYVSSGEPVDIPQGYYLDTISYYCEQEVGSYIWIEFNFFNGVDSLDWTVRFSIDEAMLYTPNQYPYLPYFSKHLTLGTKYVEQVNLFDYQDYLDNYENGYNQSKADIERLQQQVERSYDNGYTAGYQDGLNAENPYSFGNLLSSIIDVPINAFRSLFNFELLGVNMVNFATGILSLVVVIAIIKLFI